MKKNKGITLIALVITIIVLLILAGVAIAMLSGENGILKKAAESKTKTEEGQKEEMGSLLSYEMALNLESGYKYQYGYITGFEYDRSNNRTVESVEDFEDKLPDGYKVTSKYSSGKDEPIEESEKATTYIATGMTVQKDGQEVARTVLFGDVDCNGKINSADNLISTRYLGFWTTINLKDFQKMAMNVYNDDKLDNKDCNKISKYAAGTTDAVNISQNENVITSTKNLKRLYAQLQGYIKSLSEDSEYKFEYNEETDTYKLKGVKKNTTVSTLIAALPESDKIKIVAENENKRGFTEVEGSNNVINGYYVQLKVQYDDGDEISPSFAYIEVDG